jgi:hypothetical protein
MRHVIRHTFVALSLSACSAVYAVTTVPFVFTQGTPAKAAEVNADFQALADAIDAQQLLTDAQTLRMNAQDKTIAALTAVQPSAIVSLINRVDKLDGTTPVTAADLIGNYSFEALITQLITVTPNSAANGNEVMTTTIKGTLTLELGGTATYAFIGKTQTQGYLGGTIATTSSSTSSTIPPAPLHWSLSGGRITIVEMGKTFSIVSGGRLLVGAGQNDPGTNNLFLLIRN